MASLCLAGIQSALAVGMTAAAAKTPEGAGCVRVKLQFQYASGEIPSPSPPLVRLTTIDGTAVAGADFLGFDGNVGYDVEDKSFCLPLMDDDVAEPLESFQMSLFWQTNVGPTAGIWLGPVLLTVTISDDDDFEAVTRFHAPIPAAGLGTGMLSGDHLVTAAPYEVRDGKRGVVYVFSALSGELERVILPPADWPQNNANYTFGLRDLDGDRLLVGSAPPDNGFSNNDDLLFLYDLSVDEEGSALPDWWEIRQYQAFGRTTYLVLGDVIAVCSANIVNLYDAYGHNLIGSISEQLLMNSKDKLLTLTANNVLRLRSISLAGATLLRSVTLPQDISKIYSADIDGDYIIVAARKLDQNDTVLIYHLSNLVDTETPYEYYENVAFPVAIAETSGGYRAYYVDQIGNLAILESINGVQRRYGWGIPHPFSVFPSLGIAVDGERFVVGLSNQTVGGVEGVGESRLFSWQKARLTLSGGEFWESDEAVLRLELDEVREKPVSLRVVTRDGTALGGSRFQDHLNDRSRISGDFEKISAPGVLVTVPAGEREVTYSIPLANDNPDLIVERGLLDFGPMGADAVEEDETFYVDGSAITGAVFEDDSAEFTIHDGSDAFIWWLRQRGIGGSEPDADMDGNGTADAIDWAFAGDQLDELLDRLPYLNQDFFEYSFQLSSAPIPGVTVCVENSLDFSQWTEIARRGPNGSWERSVSPGFDANGRLYFDTSAFEGQRRQFYRVRILLDQP